MRTIAVGIILMVMLPGVFGLVIKGEQGEERQYFSLQDDLMKVITENDSPGNISVRYQLMNDTYEENYTLNACGEQWCSEVRFTELFQSTNSSFMSSKVFTIVHGTAQEQVLLDLERPELTFGNHSINADNATLSINYSLNDSFGELEHVQWYRLEEENRSLLKEPNVTKRKVTLPIEAQGNITLLARITDKGGNEATFTNTYVIPDIFSPEIVMTRLIKDLDQTRFLVEMTDENLSEFTIAQDDTTLSRSVTGQSARSEVLLPFTKGDFNLTVKDVDGNTITKTFAAERSFSLSLVQAYDNARRAIIEAPEANNCELLRIDDRQEEQTMEQDGDQFRINLDISQERAYDLRFFCEDAGLRQYEEVEWVYDTTKPERPELTVTPNDDGELEISWTESSDDASKVTYRLERDGDEMYEGDDTEYVDDAVSFPQRYDYTVEATDRAGNRISSETVSGTPEKVSIQFRSPFQSQESTNQTPFPFSFATEEDTNITLEVFHDGSLTERYTFTDVNRTKFSEDIPLQEAENRIVLRIVDAYGNEREETYQITYTAPTSTTQSSSEQSETLGSDEEKNSTPSLQVGKNEDTPTKDDGLGYWWLVIAVLVALVIFSGWYAGQHEALRYLVRSQFRSRRRSTSGHGLRHHQKREADRQLNHHLGKVAKQREARQRRKETEKREALKKQKAAPSQESPYHSHKLQDLSKRTGNNTSFQAFATKQQRRPVRRQQTRRITERLAGQYAAIKEGIEQRRQQRQHRKAKQDDPFRQYLNRRRETGKEWNSPNEYRKPQQESEPEEQHTPQQQETKQHAAEDSSSKQPEKQSEDKKAKKKKAATDMDAYLQKRRKKRNWYLTEREVDRDLSRR